ncbi:hypothetical protein [Streptomyces sp. NPDC048636]|uniref:hypothetical protein n=1 Tax=Streptomyces sp. NPDC048636 TaxID=3155762 RepID=UPI003424A718
MARSAATGEVEKSGAITGMSIPVFIGLACALRFPKRKGSTRGSATTAAVLMFAVGVGTLPRHPVGLVHLVFGITIIVLLSLRSSGPWFRPTART